MANQEDADGDDLDSVAKLQKIQWYINIMQRVEDALREGSNIPLNGTVSEDDPEYQLILDCIALLVYIENEIVILYNFIRENYHLKFPELEALVYDPIDYACVVKKIGNEMDVKCVDLEGILPSATLMVVSVTASTTSGKPLPEENLMKTVDACDRVFALDSAKKKVLDFFESRMGRIAPNLSAYVGTEVAAKLMGAAGSLSALANMHPGNVLLLGSLAGFSTTTSQFHVGYLERAEIFQSSPPFLMKRACRLLALKSTLAAKIDLTRDDLTGRTGRILLAKSRKKIVKWHASRKHPKPLPLPGSETKKKRGGRRLLKEKKRSAITDMRKLANRIQFCVPAESSLDMHLPI